jgi:predicted DNA-binding transcriptional regulator AlpA
MIMNDDSSATKGSSPFPLQPSPPTLWTTHEVAAFLHVSIKTIFNLRKRGLPFVALGGAVRFVPREIEDYLSKNRNLSSHRVRQIIRKPTSTHD